MAQLFPCCAHLLLIVAQLKSMAAFRWPMRSQRLLTAGMVIIRVRASQCPNTTVITSSGSASSIVAEAGGRAFVVAGDLSERPRGVHQARPSVTADW